VAGHLPQDAAVARAHRFRDLVAGTGTWRWRTTTALPAAQVERIIADGAEPAVPPRGTEIPPVRRHRDGALYVRRPLWRWGDHFRLSVQPASTGTVIHIEQRFYPPAVVSNAIVALYLGGALTGNPFTHGLWTRSPQTRLVMWVLSGVLTCLAFRLGTERLRRSDPAGFQLLAVAERPGARHGCSASLATSLLTGSQYLTWALVRYGRATPDGA
jgi:hypothetical protein